MRSKIDRLLEFELEKGEMTRWHSLLLVPVLDEFVESQKDKADITNVWDLRQNLPRKWRIRTT